jgi:hypothetical protein
MIKTAKRKKIIKLTNMVSIYGSTSEGRNPYKLLLVYAEKKP